MSFRVLAVVLMGATLSACMTHATFQEKQSAQPFVAGDERALVLVGFASASEQPRVRRIHFNFVGYETADEVLSVSVPVVSRQDNRWYRSDVTLLLNGETTFSLGFLDAPKAILTGLRSDAIKWTGSEHVEFPWAIDFEVDSENPALNDIQAAETPRAGIERGVVNYIGTFVVEPGGQAPRVRLNGTYVKAVSAMEPAPGFTYPPYIAEIRFEDEKARAWLAENTSIDAPFRVAETRLTEWAD